MAGTLEHPFTKLKQKMSQELKEEDLKRMKYLIKDKLNQPIGNITTWLDFFECLEKRYEVDKLFELLKKTSTVTNRHVDNGTESLRQVIEELQNMYHQNPVKKETPFVGRSRELQKVKEFLESSQSNVKGVSICGFAGNGKTRLAKEIHRAKKDELVEVVLRRAKTKCELLSKIVHELGSQKSLKCTQFNTENRSPNVLKDMIAKQLNELTTNTVLFLDNADDIRDMPEDVEELLEIKTKVRVTIIITTRKRLVDVTEDQTESKFTKGFDGRLLEVELGALHEQDAKCLLNSYDQEKKLDNEHCTSMVRWCRLSPLVITVMGGQLQEENISAEYLYRRIQEQKFPGGCKIEDCLIDLFELLPPKSQENLLCLSVFETQFSANMAQDILDSQNTQRDLNELVNCCFLEVELEGSKDDLEDEDEEKEFLQKLNVQVNMESIKSSQRQNLKRKVKYVYSFHPLLLDFLKTKGNCSQITDPAKDRFLALFFKRLTRIGENLVRNSPEGFSEISKDYVHINNFFDLLASRDYDLSVVDEAGVRDLYYVFKVRSNIGDHQEQLNFFSKLGQKIAEKTGLERDKFKNLQHELFLFYLRSMEQIKHGMIQNRISIETKAAQLKTMLPAILEMPVKKFPQKPFFLATYYLAVGESGLDKGRYQTNPVDRERILTRALDNLEKSEQNYRQQKSYMICEIAKVNNIRGCVYYILGDFDNSKKHHAKAKKQLETFIPKGIHGDIPNILVNIATAHMAIGNKYPKLADENFKEALKLFEQAEEIDDKLGFPNTLVQARRYRNKADLYRRLKHYDDARKAGEKSFALFQRNFQPPHTDLTLGVYFLAQVDICYGDDEKKENGNVLTEKAQAAFEKAGGYFVYVRRYLRTGGLQKDHFLYEQIKYNHLKVLKVLGKIPLLRKIEKFYRDFEAGKWDAYLKKLHREKEGHIERTSDDDDSNDDEPVPEGLYEYSECEDDDDDDIEAGGVVGIGNRRLNRLDSGFDASDSDEY